MGKITKRTRFYSIYSYNPVYPAQHLRPCTTEHKLEGQKTATLRNQLTGNRQQTVKKLILENNGQSSGNMPNRPNLGSGVIGLNKVQIKYEMYLSSIKITWDSAKTYELTCLYAYYEGNQVKVGDPKKTFFLKGIIGSMEYEKLRSKMH